MELISQGRQLLGVLVQLCQQQLVEKDGVTMVTEEDEDMQERSSERLPTQLICLYARIAGFAISCGNGQFSLPHATEWWNVCKYCIYVFNDTLQFLNC